MPFQPCAVVRFIVCLAGILTPWVVFGLASCYYSVAVASRVAQMVARLARYQKVGGSNPPRGVNFSACRTLLHAFNIAKRYAFRCLVDLVSPLLGLCRSSLALSFVSLVVWPES